MSAALIILAGLLSAPVADGRFSNRFLRHFPEWAERQKQETAAAVELTVLPNGRIASCRVLESAGSARLAAEKCAEAVGMKVKPATDANGVQTFGVLRLTFHLFLLPRQMPELESFAARSEIELDVNQLPNDSQQLDFGVSLQVSAEGIPIGCAGIAKRGEPPPEPYVEIACEQAANWRGSIVQDASGVAVPYVTNLRVRFLRSGASTARK